jgi:hypothetical protein
VFCLFFNPHRITLRWVDLSELVSVLLVVGISSNGINYTVDALLHQGGSTITSDTKHDRWTPGLICRRSICSHPIPVGANDTMAQSMHGCVSKYASVCHDGYCGKMGITQWDGIQNTPCHEIRRHHQSVPHGNRSPVHCLSIGTSQERSTENDAGSSYEKQTEERKCRGKRKKQKQSQRQDGKSAFRRVNRKRWAASDYKDKRKGKRLKDRESKTHEEMLERLDSFQACNTSEKRQSYNSGRRNKRKAKSPLCSDNRRRSNRTRMSESRQTTTKSKRVSELVWLLMQLAAKALQGTCVSDTQGTNRSSGSKRPVRMHHTRVCLVCNSFIRGYRTETESQLSRVGM